MLDVPVSSAASRRTTNRTGPRVAEVPQQSDRTAQPQQGAQQAWKDKSQSPDRRADLVIEHMTLDEKIQLVHGAGGFGPPGGPAGGPGAPGGVQQQPNRSNGGAGWIPGIPRLGKPGPNMVGFAGVGRRGGARR